MLAFTVAASPLDPALPPGSNFDLRHWYLGTPDAGRSQSIPVDELLAGHTSAWFYTGPDGAMVFWAPVNGGTTSGSSYPRSELREQVNPPENNINWTPFGTHVLEAQCRVRILPSTGRVIIGQIHGYLGDARPLLKLVFDNGRIDAQVKESPDADSDLHFDFANIPLNSLINYRVVLADGLLSITINGDTRTVDIFGQDSQWAEQTFYFKAGAYVLDNTGTSAEGGRVDFYHLHSTHVSSPRTPPVILRSPTTQSAPAGSNVVLSVSAGGALPMAFQWFKDGVLIPGADQSILPIRGVQPGQEGTYHAVVSNVAGTAVSAAGRLTVFPGLPAFSLADSLDTSNLVWTTIGTPVWHGWFGAAHDGIDQAQSGLIGDSQAVTLQTTVVGPGEVRFWWKVSSETNDDYLTFSIGAFLQARISGAVDWQERVYPVSAGSQVLRWTYAKGGDGAAGSDRAWVDEVRFQNQAAAILTHPTGRAVEAGASVSFSVAATGAAPLSYRWQCQGTNLIETSSVRGTTTSMLTLANVQPAQAGAYRVSVANAVSTVVSSNAVLSVNAFVPLSEALDASQLAWTTNGNAPWAGQTTVSHDGRDAARSGAIGHGTSTSFQTTVNGPGTLTFWWKVSSEPGNDFLLLQRGSTEVDRVSGEVDWQFRMIVVPPGSQTLRWTYSKSSGAVGGQDRAWVDEIQYVPQPPPLAPTGLRATPASMSRIQLDWIDQSGDEAGFLVERSGDGTNFSRIAALGSNTLSFVSTGLRAGSTYQFRVRATNAAGASAYSPVATAATLPFTGVRINFQPASVPVPEGYLVDSGLAFGPRVEGLSYGWNSSRTASAIDRNSPLSPDQRHDTFVNSGTSTGTRWELEVPNDEYHVFIVAGDAGSGSGTCRYGLEALTAIGDSFTSSHRWLSNRLNVTVTDGRLSISNLAGAGNNKLCFVDITRLTPLLACASDKTADCSRPWRFDKPTALADPCSGQPVPFVVTSTVTNGTAPCSAPLSVTRTWVAIDSCGRSNSCSQTVRLLGAAAPLLACAPGRTVERGSAWEFDVPVATAGCAGGCVTLAVLHTLTNTAGFCQGTFGVTRTWEATESNGGSATCAQTIIVRDSRPPALVCGPARTVEAGASWSFDVPSTDGGLTVLGTTTNTTGFCPGTFAVTRTWIATDACGDATSCSQTITVIDTVPPQVSCAPDGVVATGAAWAFTSPVAWDAASGTNVTMAILGNVTNTGVGCAGAFSVTRTWIVSDQCGNSNRCSQTVLVRDGTPPSLVCAADKIVEAGTPWSFDDPSVAAAAGAAANVVVVSTTTNKSGFCTGRFGVARTWIATDACGNSNLCTQTVTLLDTTPPVLACADVVTCDPRYGSLPVAVDGVDPAPQVICRRADGFAWGAPLAPGTNIVTCVAMDACFNTSTCQFRIVVPADLSVSVPANQTTCVGEDAVLAATVHAGEIRGVRWSFNRILIPAATNLVLTFPVTSLQQAGEYEVEIDGPCGTLRHGLTLIVSNCAPDTGVVERCTIAQGFFSARDPAAVALISSLFSQDLVLGQPGVRSLRIGAPDLALLLARLPARGPASVLPSVGDHGLSKVVQPLNDKARFSNSLLGHNIALGLSLRLDAGLGATTLASAFCTSVGGEDRIHAIPASVLAALADPGVGITNATVNGLFALGQRALAGLGTGTATADEVAAALQVVSLAFDGCRTAASCPPGLPTAPLNDAFASRVPIAGTVSGAPNRLTTRLGYTTGASAEPDEPAHVAPAARRSVWWEFTPVESGWVRVHSSGSSFDTVLAVYTGASLTSLTPVAVNDDGDTVVSSVLLFVNAGTAYQIAVDGYAGDSGNVVLNILEGVTP